MSDKPSGLEDKMLKTTALFDQSEMQFYRRFVSKKFIQGKDDRAVSLCCLPLIPCHLNSLRFCINVLYQ